nr:UTP--glucose-1-phosphate uridylyltransferase GalU [Sedimenticola hydrogenitrophicus]
MQITKAVFPVAGMGTRFLPATKANPKEMLPVVDKPLIQYAVDEAISAGITQLIFVTSSSKRAIEDHFDKNYEMESELERRGKQDLLDILKGILPEGVSCVYVRQPVALGLGHAVLCARPVVGNEPFAVILADDLINGNSKPCLGQMMDVYKELHASVLGIERIDPGMTQRYGIIKTDGGNNRVFNVNGIIEKPHPDVAPSDLAVVGRYLLRPEIFGFLEKTERGAGGEIQLTDAIAMLLKEQAVVAYEFDGKRFDCGDKLGYLKATVEYALNHAELGDAFREYLKSKIGDLGNAE